MYVNANIICIVASCAQRYAYCVYVWCEVVVEQLLREPSGLLRLDVLGVPVSRYLFNLPYAIEASQSVHFHLLHRRCTLRKYLTRDRCLGFK